VGRRLARLATRHQVIVVTHLAQVAAYADRQIVVDKPPHASADRVTTTDVRLVADADRVTELARMLAGTDSATAREHASELLSEASRDRAENAPRKVRKSRG
jgi:DNA repair protein RecN (Recombination protein N)